MKVKVEAIRAEYVDFIPQDIQAGILYVSKRFRTASHLCCCGCGTKIVTPLRETEFRLDLEDGGVSLFPSVGNWNHPCQSHYWVRAGKIEWAGAMTTAQIERGRVYDDALKDEYFAARAWPWWQRAAARVRQALRGWFQ